MAFWRTTGGSFAGQLADVEENSEMFGILKTWRQAVRARRSLAALERKVDGLERTQGVPFLQSGGVSPSPVAHIEDPPLEAKELWVKQINQERLTELGRAALGAAFVGFADQPADERRRHDYAELMSTRFGHVEVDARTQRRCAGDQALSRGRYYALCDEHGNDEGTLVGELRTYYTPARTGVVQIYDCMLPSSSSPSCCPSCWSKRAGAEECASRWG
jgi:hypothetical protein